MRVRLRDEEFRMIARDLRGDFVQPFAEDVERWVGDGQPEREAAASVEHDDGVEIEFREHAAHDVRSVVQRLRRRVAGGFEQNAPEGGAFEIVGARRPGIEFHRAERMRRPRERAIVQGEVRVRARRRGGSHRRDGGRRIVQSDVPLRGLFKTIWERGRRHRE